MNIVTDHIEVVEQPELDRLVSLYIAYGHEFGFFNAELLLMKYLPDNQPEGLCCDVPVHKRSKLIGELSSALKESSAA